MTLTLVLVADVPEGGVAAFQAFEDAVLPLLARHGGRLERRLRTDDARTEVHVVSFPDDAGLRAYRADPDRPAAPDGVVQRLLTVTDVAVPGA